MTSEARWIAVLSVLLLVIGIFLGIAMDRFLFRQPAPPPLPPVASGGPMSGGVGERALQRMTINLKLTPDQQEKMREIFRRYMPELRSASMGGGDFTAIRMKMREEIRKVLTPQQFTKFEEMFRRRMERIQRFRDQAGAPGAPPAPEAPPPR